MDERIALGNALAERSWRRERFVTLELRDNRGGGQGWSRDAPDFRLFGLGAPITSDRFSVTGVEVQDLARGGLRVEMQLAGPAGITATRIAEAYPHVAGFRTQTVLESVAPLPLTGATLDEAAVGDAAETAAHNLRAGADWRNPDYAGPPVGIGDQQTGTWRATTAGAPGEPIEANAEWLEAGAGGRSVGVVVARSDQPSAGARYVGRKGAGQDR